MQKTWVRVITTILSLGIMGMIFCFSMEPAAESDVTSGRIAELAADVLRPEWRTYEPEKRLSFYNEMQHVVRKCAHFTEFMLLGLSLRLCLESWFGKRKWLGIAGWTGGTLYAALDEAHQIRVDGRSGQWPDVLIDSAGVLTGVLLITCILYFYRRRRDKLYLSCINMHNN